MSDPFSVLIRKYISWHEFQRLSTELAKGSLIHAGKIAQRNKVSRLEELSDYEQRFGFVYVGEKQWLISLDVNHDDIKYSDWVWTQLTDIVFPDGLVFERDETSGPYWKGYTEELSSLMLFANLSGKSVQIDNIQLLIPGNASAPNETKLCHAFEILHNISYYLYICAGRYTNKVFLDQIVLDNEQGLWHMDMINDFGSIGTAEFNGIQLSRS